MTWVRTALGGGVAIVAALALFAFTGCGDDPSDGYERTAFYPPRSDPIVQNLSRVPAPTALPGPGKLNEYIASLQARGGALDFPSKIEADDQVKLTTALVALFGTPAAPTVAVEGAAAAGLTPEHLALGSRVYKRHCLQCHGMAGDGRGPTSLWVHPAARDFRNAQFKYVSTTGKGWPTPADIKRVLVRGIGGNSMPSFALLKDEELEAVTSYVLHLTLRGRVEADCINRLLNDPPSRLEKLARQRIDVNFNEWQRAQSTALESITAPPRAQEPAQHADAVRRGHALFTHEERSGCTKCHVDYGRKALLRFDVWGGVIKPAALVEGHHRGGSEASDLYRRLRCGIPGATMPPANTDSKSLSLTDSPDNKPLTDDDLWDLVAFLRALPDPKNLPDDVRRAVYPDLR